MISIALLKFLNSDPIKYEMDKEYDLIFIDQFLTASIYYPANLRLLECDAYLNKQIKNNTQKNDLVFSRVLFNSKIKYK